MIDRTQEKVEVLFGERGDKKNEPAARLRHLRAMIDAVPAEPSSVPATAAPTMAQFNQLLEDVRAVYGGLNAIRTLLR